MAGAIGRFKRGKVRALWSAGSVRAWRTLCRKAAPHIGIAADSTQSGAASSCHVFPSEKRHITQWEALFLTLHASLGSIAFHSHVLSSSSKVHWCIFHFVSLALHHICLYIPVYVHLSHYVFILHHPCTFSTTYLALSPGNSLSMLTRQHIVGGFYRTSLPSLTH
jgi:hypothetical protein